MINDKTVTQITGPGWSHRNARLVIVTDRNRRRPPFTAIGWVFTSVGVPVCSFDATDARNSARAGRAGDVSWSTYCGCSGRANPLPAGLRTAKTRELLAHIGPAVAPPESSQAHEKGSGSVPGGASGGVVRLTRSGASGG